MIAFLVATAAFAVSCSTAKAGKDGCEFEPGPVRAVAQVLDAETVRLDDGGEVRLVGALAPRSRDADADADFWQPEQEARRALERLIAGRSVELAFSGTRSDRYGRQLAHLFTVSGEARVWVQGYMVENGHARAYALPGSGGCLAELIMLETRARKAGLGLWRNATYEVRAAERTREIMRRRDTFQIIEGRVKAASDVKGHLYLNFGDDWRSDFTAHFSGEPRRTMTAAALDAKSLQGRRVRVRGWVTWRNGPYIDVHDGRLLEVLDE